MSGTPRLLIMNLLRSKTKVNKVLIIEKDLSKFIFQRLGIPDVVFPDLSGALLYSDLTNRFNEPNLGGTIVYIEKDIKMI